MNLEGVENPDRHILQDSGYYFSDIIGPLIVLELVIVQPASGDILVGYYYLTKLGGKDAQEVNIDLL